MGILQDVIARPLELSTDIGCRVPLVHAGTGDARDLSLDLVPGFETSPTDDLRPVLPVEDIRRSLNP